MRNVVAKVKLDAFKKSGALEAKLEVLVKADDKTNEIGTIAGKLLQINETLAIHANILNDAFEDEDIALITEYTERIEALLEALDTSKVNKLIEDAQQVLKLNTSKATDYKKVATEALGL